MRAHHLTAVRRHLRAGSALLVALALAATMLTSFLVAAPALADDAVDSPHMPARCFGPAQTSGEPTACHYNRFKRKRPTVVLWGDSHAWMYFPAVQRAVQGQNVNFVSFVAGSCPPIATNRTPESGYGGKCERSNVNALAYVTRLQRRGSDVKVILGSNWSGFRIAYRTIQRARRLGIESGYDDYTEKMVALSHAGTPRLFTRLGRLGADVDVIAQAAVVPVNVASCPAGNVPYACTIPRRQAMPQERSTTSWLRGQMRELAGRPAYLTPSQAYCNTEICAGNVGGIFTWYDQLHLSATRTHSLSSYFRPSIAAFSHR